ncbi:MAG: GAF domain-containing protein [Haloferacaceae archaeon]
MPPGPGDGGVPGTDADDGPVRVLHVDDDPDFRALAAELLEREDDRFAVSGAGDADEGLERLSREPFDCVVSDYDMPGRDGVEFLRAVRDAYPDLPFVLFTGKGSEEVASEAISAGVTDYLRKGTGTDQYALLANRIRNAVESRQARRRADRHERINDLIRRINRRLVESDTAEEIERAVCEALTGSDAYRFAWIGEPDPETGEVVPRTAAGDAESYLDEVTIRYDDTPRGRGPAGRAIRTREMQLARSIPEDGSFAPWRETAERHGYLSVVVLPLTCDGDLHGILAIYAAEVGAFEDYERAVLAELAETISEALAATERRRRLERYETILESLVDAVYAIEPDGTIVYVNRRYAAMKGVDREELIGSDIYEWVSGEARERVDRAREAVESGERDVGVVEYDFRTADGESFPVELRFATVPAEGSGPIGRVGVIRDVSERKARERTLERLQEASKELLGTETAADVADVATTAVQEALGHPRVVVRLISDDGTELRPVATTPEAEAMLGDRPVYQVGEGTAGRAYAAGETILYDDVQQVDDGYDRGEAGASLFVPVGEHGVLSIGDPEPGAFDAEDVHFAEIFAAAAEAALDRVEQTEARKRENERLEEFASIVSHDIRNPLNVVQGRLELARERHDDDDLDRAADALDRAFELIEDLLTVARQGGEGSADLEPVRLAEVAERCWRNVATEDAVLEVETDLVVRAAPARLTQLLENLVGNAVEHGGPDVTVTVGECEGGFYVEDDGPGIPPAERDRVFEAGYSTAHRGTGFGLRIVEQAADVHGWEVRAVEGRDGGARFEITGVERVETDDPDGATEAA